MKRFASLLIPCLIAVPLAIETSGSPPSTDSIRQSVRTIPTGQSLIPIFFDTTVGALFPRPPEGTLLATFDGSRQRWTMNQVQFGEWNNSHYALEAGEAVCVINPGREFAIQSESGLPEAVPQVPVWKGMNLIAGSVLIENLPAFAFGGNQIFAFGEGALWASAYDDLFGDWSPSLELSEDEGYLVVNRFGDGKEPVEVPPPGIPVYVNNYVPMAGIDVPVVSTCGNRIDGEDGIQIQLISGSNRDGVSAPTGDPLPLGAGVKSGYIDTAGDLIRYSDEFVKLRVHGNQPGVFWTDSEVVWAKDKLISNLPGFPVALGRSGALDGESLSRNQELVYDPLTTPVIQFASSEISVVQGKSVTLAPSVAGIAEFPTLLWQRMTGDSKWETVAETSEPEFTIATATREIAGEYRVVFGEGDSTFGCRPTSGSVWVAVTPRSIRGDFNGDSKADFLWQHTDGSIAVWFMDGLNLAGGSLLNPSNPGDPNWRIAGANDFNGDAQSDLIWQHSDGSIAAWFMDGVNLSSGALFSPSSPGDANWRIATSGDFNEDGATDLVWQHTDGTLAAWFMDGVTLTSASLLNPSSASDVDWRLVGSGDFNADSKPDLVWQHADGTLACWFMDGINLSGGSLFNPSGPGDADWRIAGVGDYNGDSKPDLSWQHADGSLAIWFLDGVDLIDGGLTVPGRAGDAEWRIANARQTR